jgi:hypothetical protein
MINSTARSRRIYWISRILRWVIVGTMGAIAATAIYPLLGGQATEWAVLGHLITHKVPAADPSTDPPLALWLGVLPKVVLLYGYYRLVKMMRACERGEFFSAQVPAHLQTFSLAIVVFELLRITLPAQIAIAHAMAGRTDGEIRLIISSEQLWTLQLAVLFMILAAVMREATTIAEDNAKII